MTSALPVELLDQIFADLTSARDLANASSVCKLFHAVVEPHLFRAVTITSLKQLRSFNQAMVDKSARAAYVLELEFAYPRLFGPGKLRTFEIMERKQGLDDFDNTLPKLTKLRTLSVGITTFFDSLPWQDFFGRAVFGDTLQSLETCILKYPRSLLSLTGFEPIFSHPTLKSLTICSADCSLRSWRALFQENPRTTLQRLEFVYCDIDPTALKRILSMTGGLKELIIKMDRGDSTVANFQDYAENLEEVATTLESLTIDTDASTSGSPFRLRNMIALRNVAIDASIWFGLLCTYPETTSEQLLRSILPPRIERMEIGGWGVTENADMSSTEDPLLQMLQPMFDDVQSLAPALKHIGRGPLPLPRVSPAFRKACMINGISTDF